MIRSAAFTMQVSSSMMMTPPDPSMVLRWAMESKSMVAPSHSSAVRTGHEDPPGIMAFNFLPLRMPPPTSSIIDFTGKPSRNSYTPGLLTWPVRQVSLVPPALGTPRSANALPPLRMMGGIEQNVSTLFRIVGHWKAPDTAGNG